MQGEGRKKDVAFIGLSVLRGLTLRTHESILYEITIFVCFYKQDI